MKKILFKLLKIYCLVLLTILLVVGLKQVKNSRDLLFPMMFLPIFGYLTTSFTKVKKRISLPLHLYGLFASLIVIVAQILNIKNISHILIVLLSLPLPLFFIIDSKKIIINFFEYFKSKPKPIIPETEEVDESRRKFIKIAVGTSLATAVMMFINRKNASAAFFGSVPGPGTIAMKDTSGNKIDPAQKQPLDGYNISDIDDGNAIRYYGFVNKDGAWYVLQENTSNNTIRYATGVNNYSTAITGAWITRASQTYGIFNDIF